MNTPKTRRPAMLVAAAVVLAVVAIAVIKRDDIAGRLLKGSDTSLMGAEARTSPLAVIAVEFLGALRSKDSTTIARLATPDQATRIQQEAAAGSSGSGGAGGEMLSDLPADAVELAGRIKSVQTHEDRGVVTFETRANSWFVQLVLTDGAWKVSGF